MTNLSAFSLSNGSTCGSKWLWLLRIRSISFSLSSATPIFCNFSSICFISLCDLFFSSFLLNSPSGERFSFSTEAMSKLPVRVCPKKIKIYFLIFLTTVVFQEKNIKIKNWGESIFFCFVEDLENKMAIFFSSIILLENIGRQTC